MNIVHRTQPGLRRFPTLIQEYSCVLGKKKEIKIKNKSTRRKKDKAFPSLTVHQSYITDLTCDSKHYVQTRLPCVKTSMTEYSCDRLVNRLPRPSNYSSTEAGEGSRSASAHLVLSPRECSGSNDLSGQETVRCLSWTVNEIIARVPG